MSECIIPCANNWPLLSILTEEAKKMKDFQGFLA